MQITLVPQRRDDSLTLHRAGNVLTINGQDIDLATYDAEAAPCDWIVGQPPLGPDGWQVTLILPHGTAAPPETLYPAPLVLDSDGAVELPPRGDDPA